MIIVHHLNNSRSQRVLWLLEELGLEYDIVRHMRDPKTMLAPPELRAIHPLGKSPVICDGDIVVAESGAICQYLIDTYANGRLIPPAGTEERRRWNYFLHYAEGSAMMPLLLKLVFDRVENSPAPFFVKPIARSIAQRVKDSYILPQIKQHLDFLESELGKHAWFAGEEFSAADIQMSFPLEAAHARGGLDNNRPCLMAFLDRIQNRPAFQRALERGGAYDLLK